MKSKIAWEPIIGLEAHVQLKTQSKLFSGTSIVYGAEPNTQASAIDLGLPGVLPVINKQAVYMALKFGLSVNGVIASKSIFARKNYFYPDLAKGYQITQHHHPLITNGHLDIPLNNGKTKSIHITQAYLEEDSGKLHHKAFHNMSGVDFNRAGTPLLEIVTAPELHSADEVVSYLKKLRTLVRYLNICNANMQEGSFRCDVNLSLRRKGDLTLGTRVEIKNLNSFGFIKQAIQYEIERQQNILEQDGRVIQETRAYDVVNYQTKSLRAKEEICDYHYFSDPDLLPLEIDDALLANIRKQIPELPAENLSQ